MIHYKKGVLYRDGKPEYLLSADYPYYRDDVDNWRPRLQQLKALGILTVTFYIPWRHHEVGGELDFTGHTRPNRNVVYFLELVQAEGLTAIVKPGPFIHAEVDFGGLPDDLSDASAYETMLDSEGKARHWHKHLPAPLARPFTGRALAWFESCLAKVIRPYVYPAGPVIALQVLNEGVYSTGNRRLTAFDYSASSLAEYRRRYGPEAAVPRRFQPPQTLADVLPYLNWGRYQSDYMTELYGRFGSPLQETGLPVLTNQNPAHAKPLGMDWWLTRVNPERWPTAIHYGFTNWIGCVSHDLSAFNRYLLLCKRQPGPNLEENWAFSELYDTRYRFTVVPFFQTVLAMAAGATGFNIYTGVGTAHWDQGLDSHMKRPYPDTAPIGADGALHPKAETLRLLAGYLGRFGSELATARPEAPVSWAIYPPYAALASWSPEAEDWAGLQVKPPRCGTHGLDNFQRTMRLESRDFRMINVETGPAPEPAEYPALVLCGGFFMDRATQERLLAYVRAGGTLILAHDMPRLDDRMEPCTLLSDGLTAERGQGRFIWLPENPFEDGPSRQFLALLTELGLPALLLTDSPDTQAWVLRAENGAEHYFILSTTDAAGLHRAGPVAVRLPGRSAAVLRVEGGKLTAALIKGVNDCDGVEAVPFASCGGVILEATEPCDVLMAADGFRTEARP